MRWLALSFVTTCCMAQQQSAPPPVIPLGSVPKEVEIDQTYWYPGHLTSSSAVLIGEVTGVASEVHQSVSQIGLEESCTLRLTAMYGTGPELAGATTARLHASYAQDMYQQLEPDWSVYQQLKVGQRAVALLHRYEGELVIGYHALIVLNEQTQALPDILRRTGCDASRFTAADLAVLNAASPLFCDEVAVIAGVMTEMRSDEAVFLNKMVGICTALFFGAILSADHFRRRLHSPQNPTT